MVAGAAFLASCFSAGLACATFLCCLLAVLLWVVVFYVTANSTVHIPFYSDLGQWNVLIGMGFIVAAFGFATKWE